MISDEEEIVLSAIEEYRKIREGTDGRTGVLEREHCGRLACRPGCCDCCVNLSVFPVEFHTIVDEMRADGVMGITFDESLSCGFLKGGLCSIYRYRPMICRTHGLPIAFVNMDAEEPEMSVSFCPKNFVDSADLSFGEENTLNLDELNYGLYEANVRFVEEHPELGLGPDARIPLRELVEQLAGK